jgi:hypothetical protein
MGPARQVRVGHRLSAGTRPVRIPSALPDTPCEST